MSDLEYLRHIFSHAGSNVLEDGVKHFYDDWHKSVEVVDAQRLSDTTARASYRFPVEEEYANQMGSLHGGAQAAFFDICTSFLLLLIAQPGFWAAGGTSRTLNVTYLRPAQVGKLVRLDCEIVHAGKRLSMLRGTLVREEDGAVISTCEHNKYNLDADSKI